MNQKKLTYRLFLMIWLLVATLMSQAENVWYSELPDSVRSQIRLTAYLLIPFQNLTIPEMDSLINEKIPLALSEEYFHDPGWAGWIKKLSVQQKQIPVLTNNNHLDQPDKNTGLIFIKSTYPNRVQLDNISQDSLFSDSLFSFNELLYVIPVTTKKTGSYLFFRLWDQSGKLPNFIFAQRNNVKELARIVMTLNSFEKFFGVVRSKDKLTANVSWRDYPNRRSNGYFCFPIIPHKLETFVPYIPGYRFSPDIIHYSPNNRDYLKEFKAFALDAGFELTDHFVFGRQIRNIQRKDKEGVINNGVKLINDPEQGHCAWFSGKAYIDGGGQSISSLKSGFSITGWIKPTKTTANNSIFGKGKNFVLKLQHGILTYTMQGIMDYRSEKSKVPVNQWTFISLVHSAYENRIRFYINGRLTDQTELITPYTGSEYTLLIGSNLWEEFFIGYIGDIKIWARELNENEIRQQFENAMNEKHKNKYTIFFLILMPILLCLLFVLGIKRNIHFLKRGKSTHINQQIHILSSAEGEKILCFGGLKVINREGTDISQKFSPKLKKLFVLIFLYSINGQKGITTGKLSGILWPGTSLQDAKNTRGTNIQNLKAALASCTGIKLVFRDKLWFLDLNKACYSDYADATTKLDLLEKQGADTGALKKELPTLLPILKKGTLFPNMNESWLDPYISKMSDRIIEVGLTLFNRLDEEKYISLLYELAGVVSLNDPLNEPALKKKIHLLTRQGKLSLAWSVYDHFTKLYLELYQEVYPIDFRDLTSHIS